MQGVIYEEDIFDIFDRIEFLHGQYEKRAMIILNMINEMEQLITEEHMNEVIND